MATWTKLAAIVGGAGLAAILVAEMYTLMAWGWRVDNDRRAMIEARFGNCSEAWRLYRKSQGVSGSTVSLFCAPALTPEKGGAK